MEIELPNPQVPCAAIEINALELNSREKGVVCGFADDCLARKYLSMGILPGSHVELIRKAPVGQTCFFKIDGRSLAVRKKEAACLLLHRMD